MDIHQYLDLILPATGYRAVMIPTPAENEEGEMEIRTRHVCTNDNQVAAKVLGNEAKLGRNAYICMASMQHQLQRGVKFRTQANAAHLRTFFLDIDVTYPGDPKSTGKYQTREEAVIALRSFCKAVALPRPMLVGSGAYGLYVFWRMAQDVAKADWQPVAERLKRLCKQHGLKIDTVVPADSARVLRPVGTFNYKRNEKHPVTLLGDHVPPAIPLDTFDRLVTASLKDAGVDTRESFLGPAPQAVADFGTNTQREHLPVSLGIVAKHCQLLGKSVANGGATDAEPVWHKNMGIAAFCDKPEEAVRMLAGRHDGYNEAESMEKMQRWKNTISGPPSCQSLGEVWYNECGEDPCHGCEHHGKITTPLQLGRYRVPEPPTIVIEQTTQGPVEREVPSKLGQFSRAHGRIIFNAGGEDDAVIETVICPVDLYPMDLIDDEHSGERHVVWRAFLPHGVVKEFSIAQRAHYVEAVKLCGELGARGVTVLPKHAKFMQEYMVTYIQELEAARQSSQQYGTLGWRDGGFVMLDKLIGPEGNTPLAFSVAFKNSMPGMGDRLGDEAAWVKAMQFYSHPAYFPFQLAFLIAVGAPLLKFTNVKGAIVSLCGSSGAGKSTVLQAVNSVWGHPDELMLSGTDSGATANAFAKTLSARGDIPVCLDEVTMRTPQAMGALAYSISQAMGKMRLDRSGNFQRQEGGGGIALMSTNTSILSKIAAYKAETAAEMMRCIEFRVGQAKVHTKSEADAMIETIAKNHGMIGEKIIQFVVTHMAAVEKQVRAVITDLDETANINPAERYWSAAISCGLVMGSIMKRLGLLTWDLNALGKFALRHIDIMRAEVGEHNLPPERMLVGMLEDMGPNTIVMTSTRGNMAAQIPLVSPRGPLWVRREIDTHKAWVDRRAIKAYCAERGIDMQQFQTNLLGCGIVVNAMQLKTLGAGAPTHTTGQSRCWVIELNHPIIMEHLPPASPTLTLVPKKTA